MTVYDLASDPKVSPIAPVIGYWVMSVCFMSLEKLNAFPQYRTQPPQDVDKKNLVTKSQVFVGVIGMQAVQIIGGIFLAQFEEPPGRYVQPSTLSALDEGIVSFVPTIPRTLSVWLAFVLFYGSRQFIAFAISDCWHYFVHRFEHVNKWVYKNVHSQHHRLYVPYAFGALYNHPAESVFNDILGGLLTAWLVGLTNAEKTVFFTLATLKTVDDHCGYQLPWDIISWIGRATGNDAYYHAVHHEPKGIKAGKSFLTLWSSANDVWHLQSNYAAVFTVWDDLMGTRKRHQDLKHEHAE
ncbi:hypothetical protein NA57DRAFT_56359 [Rhizodiscina lignyota]|uniref:Fatty acid hydroxylase domain-containing protein n=1 Tax=Rhizodiscina lignyota TaxID=1504668 RepID=A0A9P4M607_9PEZI|nr:hypothetical protein NA57DRAFT_56359 [Rhizodiscina lignyota]